MMAKGGAQSHGKSQHIQAGGVGRRDKRRMLAEASG